MGRERLDAGALADLHRQLVATRSPNFRQVFCLCVLAELYADAGLAEAGLRVLASIETESRNAFNGPETHRIEGELLLRRERPARVEAEQCFRLRLTSRSSSARKSLELRAVLSLSRLWLHQDRRDAARQLLGPIYNWFTEGFDTTDLKDARALLEELS
jgi:predicted ATPase